MASDDVVMGAMRLGEATELVESNRDALSARVATDLTTLLDAGR